MVSGKDAVIVAVNLAQVSVGGLQCLGGGNDLLVVIFGNYFAKFSSYFFVTMAVTWSGPDMKRTV
jgi:hypothetical protein